MGSSSRARGEMLASMPVAGRDAQEAAGIWPAYVGADTPLAREMAGQIVDGEIRGAYVFGGNGTGKTHLACAVAQRLCAWGWRPVVTSATGMMADVRASYDGGGTPLDAFCSARMLVLDDADKLRMTDWELETLYRVMDARRSAGLPTVTTANRDPSSLRAQMAATSRAYADAIYDRLRDGCRRVEMTGRSRRGWADA